MSGYLRTRNKSDMSFDNHMDFFEEMKFSLRKGKLHFSTIPDKDFIEALNENTEALQLHFPLDQILGDVTEIAESNWSLSVRQARLTSDLLIEEYVTIENLSRIRHLVLEVDAFDKGPSLDDRDIRNWQHALLNFERLKTLKIVFKIGRKRGRKSGGVDRRLEMEKMLSDLKYQINPFEGGKLPETAIE